MRNRNLMLFVFIIFVSVLTACTGAEKVTVEITPETKPPEEVKALPTETIEVEATVEKQPEEEPVGEAAVDPPPAPVETTASECTLVSSLPEAPEEYAELFAVNEDDWVSGPEDSPKRDFRSLLFIAEILSRFDVIVLSEVSQDSPALAQLMAAMNQYQNYWGHMFSDSYDKRGKSVQMPIIFDIRRVHPSGNHGPIPERFFDQSLFNLLHHLPAIPYAHSFDVRGKPFTLLRLKFFYREKFVESIKNHPIPHILSGFRKWAADQQDARRHRAGRGAASNPDGKSTAAACGASCRRPRRK